MNGMEQKWNRLVKLARQAPPAPEPEMPYGFATRVVARWPSSAAPSAWTVWESLSGRILAVSCALMILSVLTGYQVVRDGFSENWTTASATLDVELQ